MRGLAVRVLLGARRTLMPVDYDYTRATSEVYAAKKKQSTAKYAHLRDRLDYNYHPYYQLERQAIQDVIVDEALRDVPQRQPHPWIIFTGGPMGAGKGYVLRYWQKAGVFPLDRFVMSDPDKFKYKLPEIEDYIQFDEKTAGSKTHKESGLISEIVTMEALEHGCNVIVDGSLRDVDWHMKVFKDILTGYVSYKIAIFHVIADASVVEERAVLRGQTTGRYIPRTLLQQSIDCAPKSVATLANMAHCVLHVENGGDREEPVLLGMKSKAISLAEWGALEGLHTYWTALRTCVSPRHYPHPHPGNLGLSQSHTLSKL
mmetsp:Transcript_116895/g.203437  ORF Transcript_116895/g.203437 Transcript_116895/m.203437 type:complete len:316 (-) Transcript_116895:1170-2117(-)